MDDIYSRFRDFVIANDLITSGDKILLSLSAGKDSMFMLHLMKKLQQEITFSTGIFHLNHLTRGIETDKDEFFIKNKSEEFSIPCYIERFDFNKNKISGISFEEQARDKRYSLLRQISESENYNKIATAHNLNDNAETVLMRILSGTGISGVRGILPVTDNIIRPVLFAQKNEIYSYLENHNLQWREDLSNEDNTYLRNYLRNVILPSIAERFPPAEENLVNLAKHAIENQSLIMGLSGKLYPDAVNKAGSDIIISLEGFHEDFAQIKFFISKILSEEYGIKVNISIFGEIYRRYLINSANMILYEKGNLVIRKSSVNNKKIIIIGEMTKSEDFNVNWGYPLSIEDGNLIRIPELKKELKVSIVDNEFYNQNKERNDVIFLQPEQDVEHLEIRNRRAGDRIIIETGSKKIKEIMIEKKLDIRVKNSIPLIVADNHVAAYLPGLVNSNNNRIACNFHIKDDTKRILAFFFSDY
ncbi:MAG: tRNA lysidine(34) synthetase TilS [Spirochaetae bacterium HGW-Spirochaetae-5]|nr:MAG: tRNA lysidine(34) synthetase TilS [Spirochaetae bacterium HGW-Spirochaetae-5]